MIVKGISQKKHGSMKLFADGKNDKNREQFFSSLGFEKSRVVSAGIVHGESIATVGVADGGKIIPDVDGLTTDETNLLLTVTVADCLPLYFWNEAKRVVGIAHAGWRGVAKNIVGRMVSVLQSEYGCEPGTIRAEVGPHIQICHFAVGADLISKFGRRDILYRQGSAYLNLSAIVAKQLAQVGVREVTIRNECTYCLENDYFSFRRDQPHEIEAMVAYIGMT
ncbi:hypothetical protein A2242_02635 [Candidatus Falkowbacteria bacterium RIFOXYA2_FULL_47_9]|uniref:Purine nucleoside phosphorylase n=1 Tax=Candidatus Falkowbacteria bacterium RIFOXYA2_FULL_47_9 TaxID=1797995 RepID=A0A1F5SPD6_9BACT|nr:MAG: hypothetical protein A2242_02635 [Candidatus Falkowbacteria bacterium RIFOXYA2_FULL_47_9]